MSAASTLFRNAVVAGGRRQTMRFMKMNTGNINNYFSSTTATVKYSLHRQGTSASMQHFMQRYFSGETSIDPSDVKVDSDSWTAEHLQEQGEQVIQNPMVNDPMELSDETVNEPSDKVKRLVSEIIQLNILECQQMLKLMQKRLGIPDAQLYGGFGNGIGGGGAMPGGGGGGAPAAGGAPEAAAAPAAKEKTVFDVKIGAVDAKAKIKIIKEVRAITSLGLKEAKELVEKAPVVVKEGVKKEEVEALQKQLEAAGAVVELI